MKLCGSLTVFLYGSNGIVPCDCSKRLCGSCGVVWCGGLVSGGRRDGGSSDNSSNE